MTASRCVLFFKKGLEKKAFSTLTWKIPDPTWSLKDLNLTSSKKHVSKETLEELAKRCLIDLDRIENKNELGQDLANMLHCLDQVIVDDGDGDTSHTVQDMYDVPRGVQTAPVRDGTATQDAKNRVWENLLEPKTIRQGNHRYFAIKTQEKNDNQ